MDSDDLNIDNGADNTNDPTSSSSSSSLTSTPTILSLSYILAQKRIYARYTTFVALPAEIRQKILFEVLPGTEELLAYRPNRQTQAIHDTCKTLREDLREVGKRWDEAEMAIRKRWGMSQAKHTFFDD